jgi:hypothetical protein
MFTDITLSTDINEKFKEFCRGKSLENGKGKKFPRNFHEFSVDFNIMVLTAGSWPLQTQAMNFNVPQEVNEISTKFPLIFSLKNALTTFKCTITRSTTAASCHGYIISQRETFVLYV